MIEEKIEGLIKYYNLEGRNFVNNIQETQRMEISSYLTNFIEKMKTTENLNYMDLLKNSMGQNILLAIMIWFFGTTVIRDTSSFWNCIL